MVYTFSIYKRRLNVCLTYFAILSSSTSHPARFLVPVVLLQVPAVELQQGWLGLDSLLTRPSHHCSQSWKYEEC